MSRELCRENYVARIMSLKASPSVLLHKSKVTYRDTGVSKNTIVQIGHIMNSQLNVYFSFYVVYVLTKDIL